MKRFSVCLAVGGGVLVWLPAAVPLRVFVGCSYVVSVLVVCKSLATRREQIGRAHV